MSMHTTLNKCDLCTVLTCLCLGANALRIKPCKYAKFNCWHHSCLSTTVYNYCWYSAQPPSLIIEVYPEAVSNTTRENKETRSKTDRSHRDVRIKIFKNILSLFQFSLHHTITKLDWLEKCDIFPHHGSNEPNDSRPIRTNAIKYVSAVKNKKKHLMSNFQKAWQHSLFTEFWQVSIHSSDHNPVLHTHRQTTLSANECREKLHTKHQHSQTLMAESPTLTPRTLNSASARLILEAAVGRSFPLAMTLTSRES